MGFPERKRWLAAAAIMLLVALPACGIMQPWRVPNKPGTEAPVAHPPGTGTPAPGSGGTMPIQ